MILMILVAKENQNHFATKVNRAPKQVEADGLRWFAVLWSTDYCTVNGDQHTIRSSPGT